jgi:hypothetical protein
MERATEWIRGGACTSSVLFGVDIKDSEVVTVRGTCG